MKRNSKSMSHGIIKAEDSDSLLRSILDSSTEYSIVVIDLDLRIIIWNKGATFLFGYEPEEALGKKITFLNPPKKITKQQIEQIFNRVLRTGKWTGVVPRRKKDNDIFNSTTTITLRKNTKGAPVGFTIINRDLTGEQKIEEELIKKNIELVETTKLLNNILESSVQYSIIATDLSGLILSWNEGAHRNYGYTHEEVVNKKNIHEFHSDVDMKSGRVDVFFNDVLKSGKSEGVFERIRKNGDIFVASVFMSRRDDAKGRPIGYLVISKDITEERRYEAQMRINQELEEQNLRVKEVNRLKSEFLANMSHELRTPLNGIIGFAELLYDGKVGPVSREHREFLGDILTSAHHLLQLINDVLDLAKIEAGKMEFHPVTINLHKIIVEVNDILRTMMAEKNITCEIHVDKDVNKVMIDPAKLKQVLYNYLSNAIKFSSDGGNISINAIPEGKNFFRIEVKDEGIGISSEHMNQLFVEFQQIDSSIAKRYRGTGLGLALTRRIVEAQCGKVGVESQLSIGSTFYAILPRNPILDIQNEPLKPVDANRLLSSLEKAGVKDRKAHKLTIK